MRGALVGGLAFILPGLVLIVVLAALFLGSPPLWVAGAGAGAGSVVAAVAVHAAAGLLPASARRAHGAARIRWALYVAAGVAATALLGAWVVLVLSGAGPSSWRGRATRAGFSPPMPGRRCSRRRAPPAEYWRSAGRR